MGVLTPVYCLVRAIVQSCVGQNRELGLSEALLENMAVSGRRKLSTSGLRDQNKSMISVLAEQSA